MKNVSENWVTADAGRINGKRYRKRFQIEKYGGLAWAQRAARDWISAITQNQGAEPLSDLTLLPDRVKTELLQAYKLALEYNFSVLEVAQTYANGRTRAADPWTFRQAVQALIARQKEAKRKNDSVRSVIGYLGTMCQELGEKILDDITIEDLERFLKARATRKDARKLKVRELRSATIRNYRRYANMLFRFAIKRGKCLHNPAAKLELPSKENDPVVIYTVDEVKKLLEKAERKLLPYLVVGFFAGLRPIAETGRLEEWQFDFGPKPRIKITAAKTKTRRTRYVDIRPNLLAWLRPLRDILANPPTYEQIRSMRARAAAAAGIKWHQDVLRHCFASYHLALGEDPARTAFQMGTSEKVLFENYHDLVSREEALSYFEISPIGVVEQSAYIKA